MAAPAKTPSRTAESLNGMTKAQLLDAACALGVKGVGAANTKAEITASILEVI